MGKNLPLLMTASVSTRGMKGARFTDLEREQMYVETLAFYIQNILGNNPQQEIIFAENSGWDLEHIKTRLSEYELDRVEFIALPKEAFDISRGKGYNELLLINMTIECSAFIQKSGAFFKVTGRYPIFNIGFLIREASLAMENGMVMYCDVKDHSIFDMMHLNWCGHSVDARLFCVTTSYYKANIGSHYSELDDYEGYLLEGLLYNLMKDEYKKGKDKYNGIIGGGRIRARFSREPEFGGMEGSHVDAISFSADQNSFKSKIKRLIGNGFRICLPWIWV